MRVRRICFRAVLLLVCLSTPSADGSSSSSASSPGRNLGILPAATNIANPTKKIPSKETNNGQICFQGLAQLKYRRWVPIAPFKKWLNFFRNPKFTSKLASTVQFGIVAYLVVEIFRAVQDVYQEMQEEQGNLAGNGNGSINPLLSPAAVRKLVLWLQSPKDGPRPSISPSWMTPLALDLMSCHGVSWNDLERILLNITRSQATLLQTCLLRPSRKVSFETIGGLNGVKTRIEDWVASSFQVGKAKKNTPYDNFVNQGRQGMVLWGPPGCGKSMLMQAVAKKSGRPTLVVTPSLIQRKWYGESTNQVRALFGLVSLLGPCIVVLDELDGLFRVRNDSEIEASRELKTEWLQWWDGVASSQLSSNRVCVVAATNRPWDVDPAVWRRLPQRYYIGVPTCDERCDLVGRWTEVYQLPPIHPTVVEHLTGSTEGYTPSDLYQILQFACQTGPMARQDAELTIVDIQHALHQVPPTRYSQQYISQLQGFLAPARSYQQQQQQQQMSPQIVDDAAFFQTPMGNFYQYQVPVDSQVFDVLQDLWWQHYDWESSDGEGYDEGSDEEDNEL